MENQNALLILVIVLLLFGCTSPSTATGLPIQSPVSHPSRTPSVEAQEQGIKEEKLATATTIPTSTTEPPLKSSSPYFAYFREMNGIYQLVMMDADGRGRKIIELPKELGNYWPHSGLNINQVSPNGKWLAFYSGSAGGPGELPGPGPFDLILNLLNLETGEKQIVTPLLSKDYPENFKKAAEQLNDPYTTPESLQAAFLYGITNSIAWSPDGRHLAFGGQMDGLSSDLYVYDLETKVVRRLSSGNEELQWIDWAPDGKWILHGSMFWVGEGMSFDVYAAAADGSSIRDLSAATVVGEWLNSREYFEYDNQNGPGDYGLRLVDVDTGKVRRIWDGAFESYKADLSGKWLALTAVSPDMSPYSHLNSNANFSPGLYLINLDTMKKTSIKYPPDEVVFYYSIFPIKTGNQIFFLNNEDLSYAFYLSETGEIEPSDIGYSEISFSPDQAYWIAIAGREARILSAENKMIRSVSIPMEDEAITDVIWRPDSSGLFIICRTAIYSLNRADGEVTLVETNLVDSFGMTYQWIDNQ